MTVKKITMKLHWLKTKDKKNKRFLNNNSRQIYSPHPLSSSPVLETVSISFQWYNYGPYTCHSWDSIFQFRVEGVYWFFFGSIWLNIYNYSQKFLKLKWIDSDVIVLSFSWLLRSKDMIKKCISIIGKGVCSIWRRLWVVWCQHQFTYFFLIKISFMMKASKFQVHPTSCEWSLIVSMVTVHIYYNWSDLVQWK